MRPEASSGPSTSPLEVTLDFVVALGAAAVILGAIGIVRSYLEFGAAGLVAFGKLVLAPVVIAALYAWSPLALPSKQALRATVLVVIALTGVAFALSAAFGVGWLVAK